METGWIHLLLGEDGTHAHGKGINLDNERSFQLVEGVDNQDRDLVRI